MFHKQRFSAPLRASLVACMLTGFPHVAHGDDSVLGAIETLESARDPKCHATASRLEDFMYGTPLTHEARIEKNRLIKGLARTVWTAADPADATKELAAEEIRTAMGGFMKLVANEAGDHVLRFPNREEIVVEARDLAHYGSVAYSLRAILAVRQDSLFDSDVVLRPLSDEAVASFKQLLDLAGLAVLQSADRDARKDDRFEISKAMISAAWERLFGDSVRDAPASVAGDRTARDGLLKELVTRKIKAYQAYNQISNQLLVRNMQVYYARLSWPESQEEAQAFKNRFISDLTAFAAELYLGSAIFAEAEGRGLIREEDVAACAQRLLPHAINEYEDVIYFPNFEPGEQTVIEAYDLDSFRDSGVHWQYLGFALEDPRLETAPDADPFACELIAENVAQFGVLLLRIAGQQGMQKDLERLSTELLEESMAVITKSVVKHAEMPDRKPSAPGIRSAVKGEASGKGTRFENVTDASGIDVMHRSSDWLSRLLRSYLQKDETTGIITIPPAFGGSGIAAGDINNDGIHDVLILTGLGNRLFLGLGDGRFRDITDSSGIAYLRPEDRHPGEPRQPLIADLDNDGNQDILITYVDQDHRLYQGRGDGTFTDVTATAGLGGANLVGGPATVFDYDNDGLLDVYITYFGDYPRGSLPTLMRRNSNGLPNRLFRNLGDMRFEDVTDKAGVGDTGWGQAVTHTDFNGDGLQDLIVGNDFGVNVYYQNMGDGTFRDVAPQIGTDKPSYTMSIGTADLNRDLLPDVYISNIVTMNKDEKYVLPNEETRMKFNLEKLANMRVVEANDLFLSDPDERHGVGYELSDAVGRGYSSTGWAWDADFFDADNDGDDDLYVLNGMNEFNLYSSRNPYFMDPESLENANTLLPVSSRESNVFFINENGKLNNASQDSGLDFSGNSRSAIYLDFDNDGDLDVITNDLHGPARVFRNNLDAPEAGWIKFKLTGDPAQGVNLDAIGAKLIVTTEDGTPILREIQGSTGYMSVHPKTVHVGLGATRKVGVRIVWPNGRIQKLENLEAGRLHRISYEPTPQPEED